MPNIGNNYDKLKEQIQEMAVDYAKCDKESQILNDKRADIRERAKDLGLDTKAWQNEIQRAKQRLKIREGYDESAEIIRDALGDMDIEDLFEHVLKKEREKEEQKEEKAKKKTAKKAAKDEKPIGVQQADAIAETLENEEGE